MGAQAYAQAGKEDSVASRPHSTPQGEMPKKPAKLLPQSESGTHGGARNRGKALTRKREDGTVEQLSKSGIPGVTFRRVVSGDPPELFYKIQFVYIGIHKDTGQRASLRTSYSTKAYQPEAALMQALTKRLQSGLPTMPIPEALEKMYVFLRKDKEDFEKSLKAPAATAPPRTPGGRKGVTE